MDEKSVCGAIEWRDFIVAFALVGLWGCDYKVAGGGSVSHDPERNIVQVESVEVTFSCCALDGFTRSSNRWSDAFVRYRWSETAEYVTVSAENAGQRGDITVFKAKILRPQVSTDLNDDDVLEYFLHIKMDGVENTSYRYRMTLRVGASEILSSGRVAE